MKKRLLYVGIIFVIVTYLIGVRATIGNFSSGEEIMARHTPSPHSIYEYERSPFEFARTRSHYVTLISLANDFTIDMPYSLARAAYPDSAQTKDTYFSFANPGLSLLALPFYKIGTLFNLGQVFAALFVGALGILNVFGIYYITRRALKGSQGTSMLAAFIYGFATMAWVYSTTFIYHTPINTALIAIIIAVYKLLQSKKKVDLIMYSRLIWIIMGLVLIIDNPAFIAFSIIIPTIFFIIYRYKKEALRIFMATSVWLVLFLSVAAFSQQTLFGNWRELINDQQRMILEHTIPKATLDTPLTIEQEAELQAIERKLREDREFLVFNNTYSIKHIWKNVLITLFSPDQGMFLVHIIFVFSFLGINKKTRLFALALLPLALWTILFYSAFIYGYGANAFGPRYLMPLVPLLTIVSTFGIVRYKDKPFVFWSTFVMLLFSILTFAAPALSRFSGLMTFTNGNFGVRNLTLVLENYSSMLIYEIWLRNSMPLWPIYLIICITLSIYAFYLYRFILQEKTNEDQ